MRSLYVWENVLCDYSCGMAIAIADSKEEAIAQFERKSVRNGLEFEEPTVIPMDTTKNHSFYVWGGG